MRQKPVLDLFHLDVPGGSWHTAIRKARAVGRRGKPGLEKRGP
jgi:hypothetical protein